MAVYVRAATVNDLPAIAAIYNDAVRTTTAIWNDSEVDLENRRSWLTERMSRGFPVIVAAEGDDVAGYATFGDFRPYDGYRHTVENSIYVHRNFRGQGVGALMMPVLIEIARTTGKHAMVAAIEAGNEASLRFHARFGFREVARMPEVGRKFDRWLDLVLMQRLILS